jgi:hypothetical protein
MARPRGSAFFSPVRGAGAEAKQIQNRLAGFDLESSDVWKVIQTKFGAQIIHTELRSIAQLICGETGLKLDRAASRDNRVLVKSFSDHWKAISPIIDHFYLCDECEADLSAEPSENGAEFPTFR